MQIKACPGQDDAVFLAEVQTDGAGRFEVLWPWPGVPEGKVIAPRMLLSTPVEGKDPLQGSGFFTRPTPYRSAVVATPPRLDPATGVYCMRTASQKVRLHGIPFYGTVEISNPERVTLMLSDFLAKSHTGVWSGACFPGQERYRLGPFEGSLKLYSWNEDHCTEFTLEGPRKCKIALVDLAKGGSEKVAVLPDVKYSRTIAGDRFEGCSVQLFIPWACQRSSATAAN
ncbi:MAG: hypothetical protein R3F17_16900 [Planctomycetota bacterium]